MANTKNRFSMLLDQMLTTADIKQYTLAKELNYDTSYISKWLNGHMIPGEKSIEEVLHGISACIIKNGTPEGLQILAKGYMLENFEELSRAIYDQLLIEYQYVSRISTTVSDGIAPEIDMYPEMSVADFLRRLKHPVLRRISNLHIVSAVDLLSLNKEYQLEFASLRLENKESLREYPNVHYRLIIDVHDKEKESVVEQIMLLSNMMVKMSHISSEIYASDFASGKIIFSVRDEFCISGMLHGPDRCVYVVTTEGEKYTSNLYRVVREICTKDNLCFIKREIEEMVNNTKYLRMLIAPNQYWLVGQLSECLLPEDLLNELLVSPVIAEKNFDAAMIKNIGRFLSGIRQSSPIKCMIHERALADLALKGEIDVFGQIIRLDYDQRKKVLDYLLELSENHKMEIRLIQGMLPDQMEFLPPFSLITSDNSSYLKVFNQNLGEIRIFQVNRPELADMYRAFAKEIWNYDSSVVNDDKDSINSYIRHLIVNIELLSYSQS